MSKDLREDTTHPFNWSDDARQRGIDERKVFGDDKQSPQQPWESNDDLERRLRG